MEDKIVNRARRLSSKTEARDVLTRIAGQLSKPGLTPDETARVIADLRGVVLFVKDWSRFAS